MKRLLVYLKGYRKESVLGPLFKLIEATFELIVPLVIARIIDKGIANGDTGYIVKMCLVLLLLGVLGYAFSVTAQYFAAKASVGFVTKLRSALFAHVQTLSYSEIDSVGTPTMITRLTTDSNQVQTGLNLALRLLLRSPFVVFGAMIMAFTIDTRSALIFAATIPALSIVVFGIMLISMPLYKKVQARLDRVLGKTRENLSGARVIRAFCKEESETEEFNQCNEEFTISQKYVGRISALMNPITYVIINIAIIVLIYTGAVQVDLGNLTDGEVVALYNYMSQILIELIKLANLIITITKSLASAARMNSVFDITSSITEGKVSEGTPDSAKVEFIGAALQYKSAKEPSLEPVSFKAMPGDTIGIIGATGSGKSTLVNMIPRFYDATEGDVLIDGINVKEYTECALNTKIAIVPQKAVLFSGSVRDNMLIGNEKATDEEIYRALDIAQARKIVEDKGGLDARIEAGGRNLSGGQRQRLTIARALVKRPEILILDDSASALDFATDAALRSAIKNMDGNTTVFIVSQRASSIMYADKILVLDDGEVIGMGRHEELLSSCDVYREIYNTQFRSEEVSA